MLKGIANQENSRTPPGVKAMTSKLSLVSLTAVITSRGIEPEEKELCKSFPSREDAKACYIPDKSMPCSFGWLVFVWKDAFWFVFPSPLRDTAGQCEIRQEIQLLRTPPRTPYHITECLLGSLTVHAIP